MVQIVRAAEFIAAIIKNPYLEHTKNEIKNENINGLGHQPEKVSSEIFVRLTSHRMDDHKSSVK